MAGYCVARRWLDFVLVAFGLFCGVCAAAVSPQAITYTPASSISNGQAVSNWACSTTGTLRERTCTATYIGKQLAATYVQLGPAYTCPSPYVWASDGNSCTELPKCADKAGKAGPTASTWSVAGATLDSLQHSLCMSGDSCQFTLDGGTMFTYKAAAGGPDVGAGWGNPSGAPMTSHYSGTQCDSSVQTAAGQGVAGATTPDKNSDPVQCAASGGTFGQVNGVNTCVANAQTTNAASEVTKTTVTTNADNSKVVATETTKTTCKDGLCSSTTTTSSQNYDNQGLPVGTPVVTVGAASPQTDTGSFCKSNPDVAICKQQSGKFSGDCKAEPTCDGDAVACATAKATWQTYCSVAAKTDGTTKIDRILAGEDPDAANLPTAPEKVLQNDLTGQIKMDRFLDASCPPDLTFELGGKVVSISFAKLCGALDLVGKGAVAATLLLAAFIVFRRT
jgi:hypothetical protein